MSRGLKAGTLVRQQHVFGRLETGCNGGAGEERWHRRVLEIWTSEWRHSFSTALGMSGFSSLEIARLMENSAAIAERHYVAIRTQDAGNRWPFKWV